MVLRPRHIISACAGYGGLDLGLQIAEHGARSVCYIEREAAAAATLRSRMEDETLHRAPIWSDVTTFDARPWRGAVDCYIAGYPCQGESLAGRRRLENDPRFIFGHIARHLKEGRIPIGFFENVGAHLSGSFPTVIRLLQEMGGTVAAGLFAAEEVGASHKRERLFILVWFPEWMDYADSGLHNIEGQKIFTGRDASAGTGHRLGNASSAGPLPAAQTRIYSSQESTGPRDEKSQRRSGQLADPSDPRQSSSPEGGDAARDGIGDRGEELAESRCELREVPSSRRQSPEQFSTSEGHEMANPSIGRRSGPGEGQNEQPRRTKTIGGSDQLADAAGERPRQGITEPETQGQAVLEQSGIDLPLYAPGPQSPLWGAVAQHAPRLLPAHSAYDRFILEIRNAVAAQNGHSSSGQGLDTIDTHTIPTAIIQAAAQSSLRGVGNGTSARNDQLRLGGNGVSPLVAAYAYSTLKHALGEHFGTIGADGAYIVDQT